MAASSAVFAIWAMSRAWASENPCWIRSASLYAPANCFRVSVSTSVVSHSPLVRDSRKEPYILMAFCAPVPSSSEVRTRASWNTLPPIPALTTEFQSIRETLPAARAWESWYMAVDACWEVEPEMAARLAMPLMESTEVRRLTPAAVNVPMFRVISVKL